VLDAGARVGEEHGLSRGRRGAGGDVGDVGEEKIGEGCEECVGGGVGRGGGGGGRVGLDGDCKMRR